MFFFANSQIVSVHVTASQQLDFLHLVSFDAVREHLSTNIHCC